MKKFSTPILILFWSYTWHAYAIGAAGQKDFLPETRQTAFKQPLSQAKALHKIQNKAQFKRRPAIIKNDVIFVKSFLLEKLFSFTGQLPEANNHGFRPQPEKLHLLRSPPVLI